MTELEGLLRHLADALERAGVPFMIAGSFASTAHGLPRTTQDLDIVIDPDAQALEALLRELPTDVYYVDADAAREALRRRSMFNVVDLASGWKADTIVSKLEWSQMSDGSERQRCDIAGVLATMGSELDRPYIERWVRNLGLEDEWALAQKSPIG
jgi:hypothetical protein